MRTSTSRGQRRTHDLLELELQMFVSLLMWVLGIELGLLQEQHTLTTEPALQPCSTVWNVKFTPGITVCYLYTQPKKKPQT